MQERRQKETANQMQNHHPNLFFQKLEVEVIQPLQQRERRLREKYAIQTYEDEKNHKDYRAIKCCLIEITKIYNSKLAEFQTIAANHAPSLPTALRACQMNCQQRVSSTLYHHLINERKLKDLTGTQRSFVTQCGRMLLNTVMHLLIVPALEKWHQSSSHHSYYRIFSYKTQEVAYQAYKSAKALKP